MVQLTSGGKVDGGMKTPRESNVANTMTSSKQHSRHSSKPDFTHRQRHPPQGVPSGSSVGPSGVRRHQRDGGRSNTIRVALSAIPPSGKLPTNGLSNQLPKLSDRHRQEPVGKELERSVDGTKLPRRRPGSPRSVISSNSQQRRNKNLGYGNQYSSEHYDQRALYDYYYYQYMQHPMYREYYRQYFGRNYGYPGGSEGFPEDKGSIRSGRSSVNDEMKKSMSSLAAHDPYELMYRQPPQSPYHGSSVPSVVGATIEKQHRLTPHQFGAPHFISKFTPGGKLLVVLPHDPKDGEKAIVQIKDMRQLLAADKQYSRRIEQMKNYAGPISYNDTHKDVVIRFCACKVSEASVNNDLEDRLSVILLWEYLSLLVKQNGKVCGADLASLLIEQKNSSPAPSLTGENSSNSVDNDGEENGDIGAAPGEVNVRPFTEYLCLGRRKEAVEYAIRHGLWGHAMMLASKMDSVTHTKVMTAFLNSIPTSDVLQTAVQHMSGKRPDVTKNFNPDRWGDWREHLAVLVSNCTGNALRDRASIIGLGDTLASRGQLHAAHFCYLAGEAEFGTFADKSSKIVLIGASHNQNFQSFATEEAFQCTEVYEYAKSLDISNDVFHTFQSYKLIYALRLAECGFAADALRYCEVVSTVVCQAPQYYEEEFVAHVLELASRLKFYDAHYQMGGEAAEMPDPEWLQTLANVLYMIQVQKTEANAIPSTETTSGDVGSSLTDSNAKPEIEKQIVQEIIANVPSPQEVIPLAQHLGSNQPVKPENKFFQQTQRNIGNYASSPSYADPNMPPSLDVGYQRTPDIASPFQQPPLPNNVPPTWQPPSIKQESPEVSTLQRRSSEEEEYWTMMGNKVANSQSKGVDKTEIKSEVKEEDVVKDGEEKRPGFFGSLFGGWKKSNQAKLPDDRNPSIVWDESKKKWVNKDGDEEIDSPPAAPPTFMVAPPPIAGSFRGGSRISRYVDPVSDQRMSPGTPAIPHNSTPMVPNRTPSTSPKVAPVMAPNGAVPTLSPTFLVPLANGNAVPGSPVVEPELQSPRITSISSHQAADGDIGTNNVPMMGAPPMFNPNQFSVTSVPSTGSLPRKAGPARRAFGQR